MPEAVNHFAETTNGREVRKIQEEIIKSYIMDFALKLGTLARPFLSLPSLLFFRLLSLELFLLNS